jgi:hypothetical protein
MFVVDWVGLDFCVAGVLRIEYNCEQSMYGFIEE